MTRDELKYKWMMAQIEPELFYLPFRDFSYWFSNTIRFNGNSGNYGTVSGGQCEMTATIRYNNGRGYSNIRPDLYDANRDIKINDTLIGKSVVSPTSHIGTGLTQTFTLNIDYMRQLATVSDDAYVLYSYRQGATRSNGYSDRNIQDEVERVNPRILLNGETYSFPDFIDETHAGHGYSMQWHVWINPRTKEIREYAYYSYRPSDDNVTHFVKYLENSRAFDFSEYALCRGDYDNDDDSHLIGTI